MPVMRWLDRHLNKPLVLGMWNSFRERRTLVLLTGDGNIHNEAGEEDSNLANFLTCIEEALKVNFYVEVWSFQDSLSKVCTTFCLIMDLPNSFLKRQNFMVLALSFYPCYRGINKRKNVMVIG